MERGWGDKDFTIAFSIAEERAGSGEFRIPDAEIG